MWKTLICLPFQDYGTAVVYFEMVTAFVDGFTKKSVQPIKVCNPY